MDIRRTSASFEYLPKSKIKAMIAKLKRAGAKEGVQKCPRELSIPIKIACRQMKIIKGKIILKEYMAKAREFPEKPGAISLIIRGEKTIPRILSNSRIRKTMFTVEDAICQLLVFPSLL